MRQIEDALYGAVANAASQQRYSYLLLDTAHAEDTYLQLDRWHIPYASLFEGTPEQSLLEIAPLLLNTAALNNDQRSKLFSLAQEMAYAAPCVSWLQTDVSIKRLSKHLQLFHTVGLSEGQAMLMRWYDTRILPIWLTCLDETQRAAFLTHISGWQYVDRSGHVVALPLAERSSQFPIERPYGRPIISLTDQQYGMLVDAAQLDILLKHLQRVIPDEVNRVPRTTLASVVSRFQQQAIDAGLDDLDRQTQYVLLGLYTSGEGFKNFDLVKYMKAPPKSIDAFSAGLQALPDEAWEAGAPLWTMY